MYQQIRVTHTRVLDIIKGTAADGPGLRNVLYMAGCTHNCPGCHNPASHDFTAGTMMSIKDIVNELVDKYTDITISGGDPMCNAEALIEILKGIRSKAPNKNIWVFTGYTYEQLKGVQCDCLKYIDVLVDGPYIESLRDLSRFCGSSNQRILHLKNGQIISIE